jgi:glycosyltransferase involved in cell wall biosynthesis
MGINEQKMAFIYCYNDEKLLKESNLSIQSLNIPPGYEIEFIPVENAPSMCAGYNHGMHQTDAKYKVYLHQDVCIINRHFIEDTLAIFQTNKNIGLLGIQGCKVIPTNGIWGEAIEKFGKVYDSHTGEMQLISFNEIVDQFELVQAVDGLIMITQYDIPWREEVFNDWHFFDISQSVEFLKNGFEVAVPKQEVAWCKHHCGFSYQKKGYEEYRNKFLDQYSSYLFPLVSILIPTYNRPYYLNESLESVLQQTYRNIEIIICDDSSNDQTELMLEPFLKTNPNIKYYKNQQRLGGSTGLENGLKCFELSTGEFVNFLNDDDKFSSEKIAKMMNYFLQYKDITLATSFRQLISENGQFLNPIRATRKLFEIDTIIDGRVFGNYVLTNILNVIGEPSTVLFRKSDIDGKFGKYLGRQYIPLSDISTWLHLLRNGRGVYMAEPQSFFRWHSGQNTNDLVNMITATSEWYYLIKDSFDHAVYVSNSNELKEKLNYWLKYSTNFVNRVNQLSLDKSFEEKYGDIIIELNKCHHECLLIVNG